VELKPTAFSDKVNDMMSIKNKVAHALHSSLNIAAEVELMEPGTLTRFEGKAKRVVDRRSFE
jgi:phenylacetate-CoA ligase